MDRSDRTASKLAVCVAFGVLLAANNASAQGSDSQEFGKLDESRGKIQVREPTSTNKHNSIVVDKDSPGVRSGRERKEERLKKIKGRIFSERANDTGLRVNMKARSMGRLDKKDLNSGVRALEVKLRKILAENEAITGIAKEVDFEILKIQSTTFGGKQVVFRQLINGVPLESRSVLYVSKDGDVERLNLYIASPGNSSFDDSTWIRPQALKDIARHAWRDHFGSQVSESPKFRYVITYIESTSTFAPSLEMWNGSKMVGVHALSGETLIAVDTASGERQCYRPTGLGVPSSDGDCDQVIGGANQYVIFKNNNQCTDSSLPACSKTEYSETIAEIYRVRTWLNNRTIDVPLNYDILYETYPFDWASGNSGGWGFYSRLPGLDPTIRFVPDFTTAAKNVRQDIAAHELGHLWHDAANSRYQNIKSSSWVGEAFIESVADTIRGFQSNNYRQNTSNGFRDFNPNTSLKWNNRTVTQFSYYDDSRVISNLFVDFRDAFSNKLKAEQLALHVYSTIDTDSDGAATFTIHDIKAAIADCVEPGGACGLNGTERGQVCSIWESNQFPGSICPPPPPSNPAWVTVNYTGACGWTLQSGGYYYGSVVIPTWANVADEDSYVLCWSDSQLSGYQCIDTFPANFTSTYPTEYVVTGTAYIGIQACNGNGCSDLTTTQAVNQCNL